MSPVATLFFQWGRCYSGFVTPLYGALLSGACPDDTADSRNIMHMS